MTDQAQVETGQLYQRLMANGSTASDIAMFAGISRRQVWQAINAAAQERHRMPITQATAHADRILRFEIAAARKEIEQADRVWHEQHRRGGR